MTRRHPQEKLLSFIFAQHATFINPGNVHILLDIGRLYIDNVAIM